MIDAFPLAWPDGWPRATHRKSKPYKVSTDEALEALIDGLRKMGARDVVVSSNVPLRRDGTMYRGESSDNRMPDPGVAVYWTARGKSGIDVPRVMACDAWLTVRENVRALGLAVECLRGLERTGAGEILERSFAGFARLPAAAADPDCWAVLGVEPHASRGELQERLRELTRTEHPDHGGSTERFARITRAYHEALGINGAAR